MDIKGVIFDFDATLVDSEDNYYLADKIIVENLSKKDRFVPINTDIVDYYIAEFYNKNKNSDLYKSVTNNRQVVAFEQKDKMEFIGLDGLEVIRRIKQKFNVAGSEQQLLEEKNKIYLYIALKKTNVYPKMLQLVQKLKSAQYKLAVASGTYKNNLLQILNATKLTHYFDAIVGGGDVKHGKPDPEIFNFAASQLGLTAQQCFVIEDSLPGVTAAINGNFHLIAVPYLVKEKYHDFFYKADYLAKNGMTEFDSDKAFNIINGDNHE